MSATITVALVKAWIARTQQLHAAEQVKDEARLLFSIPDVVLRRPDLYRRGDGLYKLGAAMADRAERVFTKELKQAFGTRYRVAPQNKGHLWVYVRESGRDTETRLVFHPSIRTPAIKPKDFAKTFEDALKHVDSKGK